MMLKEFRDFIMTGNVIDFAVAVIMAGALGAVINGFVTNIIMPFVGHFTGGKSFDNYFYAMDGNNYATLETAREAGGAVIAYGAWINTIISLIIIGFVMFLLVKAYNKTRKEKEEEPADPTEIDLLTEIRDALKK